MLTFIHIPKTAGSTMNLALRSSFGVRHCDVRKLYRENDYVMEEDVQPQAVERPAPTATVR